MTNIYKRTDKYGSVVGPFIGYWQARIDAGRESPQSIVDWWNERSPEGVHYELVDAETDCQLTFVTKFGVNFS